MMFVSKIMEIMEADDGSLLDAKSGIGHAAKAAVDEGRRCVPQFDSARNARMASLNAATGWPRPQLPRLLSIDSCRVAQ